jgi:translation initiation factor 1
MSRAPDTRLVYSTAGEVPGEATAEPPRVERDRIRIRLDRRASSRVVTVVTGLPGSPGEVTALANELKSACGAGGTVKGGVVELQGDHRDRVEAALTARGLRSKRAGG